MACYVPGMSRHNQWHLELSGWRIVLVPFAVVAALVGVFVGWVFGLKNSADLNRDDVCSYLDDFIEGREGNWDWDDFTSIPISDPVLEGIRLEACEVDEPLNEAGKDKLRELRARVRSLRA